MCVYKEIVAVDNNVKHDNGSNNGVCMYACVVKKEPKLLRNYSNNYMLYVIYIYI